VYEVYMLEVSRFLAEKADREEISPIQMAQAFNAAWTEMVKHTREDAAFRLSAVQAAEQADAESRATFRETAATIGLVLGGALLGVATAGSYAPTAVVRSSSPVTCHAVSMGDNTVTGQSYGVTLRCQ
jgi:ferric-dicitrate binding protein FerR (iron transport regulator)